METMTILLERTSFRKRITSTEPDNRMDVSKDFFRLVLAKAFPLIDQVYHVELGCILVEKTASGLSRIR